MYMSEFRRLTAMPKEVHHAYSILRSLRDLQRAYLKRGVSGQAMQDVQDKIDECHQIITLWTKSVANQQAANPD